MCGENEEERGKGGGWGENVVSVKRERTTTTTRRSENIQKAVIRYCIEWLANSPRSAFPRFNVLARTETRVLCRAYEHLRGKERERGR